MSEWSKGSAKGGGKDDIVQKIESAPRSRRTRFKPLDLTGPPGGKPASTAWAPQTVKPWQDKPSDGLSSAEQFPTLLGSTSTAPQIAFKPPTQSASWAAKPVTSTLPPTPKVDAAVAKVKATFALWNGDAHDGCKAQLDEGQVGELEAWARSFRTKSGKNARYEVVRGPGTGDYAAKDQLKIIAWFADKLGGDKNPTFHISLS